MLTYVLFLVVILMSFFTVCRRIRKFGAGVGYVTSAPKSCRSNPTSSSKIVKNKYNLVKQTQDILLSRLRTWLEFQKHLHCAFDEIF